MKITEVRLGLISVPLRVPFKTALRSVSSVEDVIVEIHTDTGAVGYGEAPPTGVITGDTTGAIIGAIRDHIAKTIIGRDVDDFEDLMIALNACIQKNTSAKAAVDMALWDLYGQLYKIPVYKLMGGAKKSIVTDITISVNDPEEMVRDALNAIDRGYDCLKVKVGIDPELDVARLAAVREAVGKDVKLRIDANQAWNAKQAVRILDQMQEKGLDIEFVEQPVPAADLEGMQYVTRHASVPVLADESVFSPADALRISLATRQHGPRPGVEAVGHAADGNGAARQRAGASRVVPGAAVEDPSGRHRAGGVEPVHGAVALVEPGGHYTARVGVEPIPGSALAQPSGIRFAVRGCVIPSALF